MVSTELSLDNARRSQDLELYEEVRFLTMRLAREVVAVRGANLENPQARYFVDQATALAKIDATSRGTDSGVAGTVIESLRTHLPDFLVAKIDIEELRSRIARELGNTYWHRFNTQEPMGNYAKSCASFLIDNGLLKGSCLELGAGVGNTSRLVHSSATGHYVRTDKQIAFLSLPFGDEREAYDFDLPGRWKNLDTIFAVNALHCAADKAKTLGFLFDMMKPGGFLVLGEGQDPVVDREPWSLNLVCGLYDGWWDRGGFLDRATWMTLLADAGFRDLGSLPMKAGRYDFGGLLWARR